MKMFRNVELLAISLLFCVGSGREPLCSRYHYEEQILAKVLRLEHRMDRYDETKGKTLLELIKLLLISHFESLYNISTINKFY
jgi:hypothetical protein